jgi:hypothetical protein
MNDKTRQVFKTNMPILSLMIFKIDFIQKPLPLQYEHKQGILPIYNCGYFGIRRFFRL